MTVSHSWNAKHPEVPVDENGNWMHYPEGWRANIQWLPVREFAAVLTIESMYTGRSAKYLKVKNKATGITYPMFVSDLVKFIQDGGTVYNGELHGKWTASKRGANYGIKAVK